MTKLSNKTLVLVAAALAAGCSSWHPYQAEEMRTGMVTDWYNHVTVYTFDKDTTNPTRSNCDAYCASIWPPYRPAANEPATGAFTIVKRDDGSPQWAYQGKPLYTFTKDTKTGDKYGDGVNGVWHVVK